MKALTARDALTESYLCVSSDGHPREFLNQVKDENVQACAVFENSTFLGLVDFKDILTCNPQRIFADLLPEPQAPPVQDDTPVQEVSRLLDRYRGNALPVLDKKSSFIGVISRDSLLYVLLQKDEHLLKLTENVKDIVQTVNTVLDLKSMLRVALRKTLEMMGLKTGWIFLYNEEASMARVVTHVNLPRKYLKDRHALLRESCLCQSEVLNKKNEATVLCLKCVRGEKVTSELKWHISIPLVSLAKPLGVMNLACQQEPCISNEELNLLTTLGKSIGTAIMNTQSFHKLEAERERLAQWSKRLSQLNKASTHLLSLLGTPILEDRLLQEGIESLCQLVEARYGVVGLFDADGKLVKFVHTGLTRAEAAQLKDLPKGMGILGALDQEQRVVRVRDVKKHTSFSGFPPHHPQMKSFLGMCIALKGKVHGRIYLTDKTGGHPFSKEDEKLVATFANSLATAMEHAHLMENLNKSEQRFRSVAQSASDAIISADSSGYIISWNNGARTIFGYQEEEVLGQPLTLLIPEWYRDAHEKGLKRMTSTGESHVVGKILELEGLRKDGSVFPLELSVATWKTEEGTFYSGIIRDITERKRAEEVLRQTNERLNLTLDNLTIVAFEIDSEGRWLLSRGKGLEKIGRRPDEVLGQSIFEYYKDKPVITEAVRKALGGQRQHIEVEMSGRIWSAHYRPVVGPCGKIERVYGTAIDTTERKRAEEVLKARALQQSVVTEFGQYALQGTDLFRLMDKAAHLVAQTLDVEYCKVLELLPRHEALLLRAGVGWKDGCVGRATVGAGIDSQAGYTLLSREAVIVEDLRAEKRFSGPQLLHDHNVVSGMSVVIAGKKRPFGVLGTHTTKKRIFTKHDIHFLQSIANVLATAIERRQAEVALERSEARFSGILDIAHEAIISIDERQKIIIFNKGAEKIFGYSAADAIGQSLDLLLPEPAQSIHQSYIAEFARSATFARRMGERSAIYGRRKNGEKFPAEASISKLEMDGERIFTVVLRDITKRKRAEEALKDSEAQYRQLVEQVPDGIYRSTPEGQFLAVNSALVKMLGYDSQEELLKISIPSDLYFSPEERNKVLKRITDGKSESNIFRLKKKDGKELWVEDHGLQVFDTRGRPIYYEGVLRNITERRKLEEQLRQAQRLEAVGELTGGIAHDFNNLLMVILGNAEFGLQDCAPGDPVYSDLAKIETAATQARDLVSQLLSFSRQQEINPKNLNLNQAIEEFLTMLNRIIGENIEVKLSLALDLLPVRADPVHVHQLLMNICLNARDAMPQGGTLTIESTNRTSDGVEGLPQLQGKSRNFVQLTITDTGHGMDNEEQSRIFEPFFTTKELGKGTGLGLSVVYGIVKQHDGHIEVSSEKDKGTTFKIYLPAVQDGESDENRKKKVSNQTVGPKTILLVDDDEAVRNVTIRILQGLGYAVHTAQNEKEAMKIFETQYQNFDLVILDVVLPESSGLEVYEKMQSIKPNLSVLFVTGYDLKTILDELKHLEQKKTRILQKPFKKETLGKTVRDLLN